MAIPSKNVLGNPNVTEGNFQIAIEQLRESVIGSGKTYDSANTYMAYDICYYNGVVYYSKIDSNVGNTPSIGANWGDYADLISGVVHKTGNETITGIKTLSNNLVFASGAKIQGDGVNILTISNNADRIHVSSDGRIAMNSTIPDAANSILAVGCPSDYGAAVRIISNTSIPNWARLDIKNRNVSQPFMLIQDNTGAAIIRNDSPTSSISFYTGGDGVNKLKIDEAGNVLVTGSGGLGYGTGSGGTVTQLTSKSTAVTLNKPCGLITMNSASLAAGASVSFVVNNTAINYVGDTVIVECSGFVGYECIVRYIGLSSFSIQLKNVTAGALAEAVVINFAIIKGATS